MSSVAISETAATIAALSKSTGLNEMEVLNEFGNYLLAERREFKTVTLDSPMSVTMKRSGTFSRIPMIGGESFAVIGAYLGKRDGVILNLLGDYEGQINSFEMPASKAEEHLEGYKKLLERFIVTYGDEDLGVDSERIESEAHAAAILQSRMSDNRFGSW